MKKLFILVALIAAACTPKTLTIVQIADAQLGFDAAVKGSVPGAEYVNDLTFEIECLKATVAKVNELKPDMGVFTGDQVHLPYDKEQWDAFPRVCLHTEAFPPTPGAHTWVGRRPCAASLSSAPRTWGPAGRRPLQARLLPSLSGDPREILSH